MRTPSLSASCITLGAILLTCMTLQPVGAGTQAEPEIKDTQYDQLVTANGSPTPVGTCPGAPPTTCIYIPADIWNAWVTESSDALQFNIELAQAPPSTFGDLTYTFHFRVTALGDAKEYVASATVSEASPAGSGATKPGGVATSAAQDGTILTLTVPRAALGDPPVGALLDNLYATSLGTAGPSGQQDVSDRAPDTGFGATYTLTEGKAAAGAGNATATASASASGAPLPPRPAGNHTAAPASGNATNNPQAARGTATSVGDPGGPTAEAKSSPGAALGAGVAVVGLAAFMRRRLPA